MSESSPNIESLFLTITNTSSPITIGVIYRPPSGDINQFMEQFNIMLSTLPKNNVYIMGDFNIDLLNHQCNIVSEFEEIFLTNGFAPLISTFTHSRPNCKKSCIDNTFTNSPDNVLLS